jgi:hypothetical protein
MRVISISHLSAGRSPHVADTAPAPSPGDAATAAANRPALSPETVRHEQSVSSARDTALSALRNERFGSMLEKISDPRASDTMMQMQRNDGAGMDRASVFAAYGENS